MVHLEPTAEDDYAPRCMELDTMSYDMAMQTFAGALNLPNVKGVIIGARHELVNGAAEQQQGERGSEQEREEKRRRSSPELVADSPVVKDNATIVKELMRRIDTIQSRWPVPDNRGEYHVENPVLENEDEYRALMAELRALQSKPPQQPPCLPAITRRN